MFNVGKIFFLEVKKIHAANPEFAPAQNQFDALAAKYSDFDEIANACPTFADYCDAIEDL